MWVRGTTHETPLWSKHFGIIFQATTTEALTTDWPAIYYISNKMTQRKMFQTGTVHLTQPKQCFNYFFATQHTRVSCNSCPSTYAQHIWLFSYQLSEACSHHRVLLFSLNVGCQVKTNYLAILNFFLFCFFYFFPPFLNNISILG